MLGKPVGNDIKEKKITLPLIFALSKMNEDEAERIQKRILKGKMKKNEIIELINRVIELGGIEYAENSALKYIERAKQNLAVFPESEAKNALLLFADFAVSRSN